MPDKDERAQVPEEDAAGPVPRALEEGEETGKVATGLGGNYMDQTRHGASVDETMLTKGERRRGGQHVK